MILFILVAGDPGSTGTATDGYPALVSHQSLQAY
jgi:hypothetical protein